MIKRIISILLVVMLIFSVAACDGGGTTAETKKPVSSTTSKVESDDSSSETDAPEASVPEEVEEIIEEEYVEEEVISVPATAELKLTALPAEHSVLLNKNPDRGFRSAEETNTVPLPSTLLANPENYTYEKIKDRVTKLIAENTLNESVTVSRVYFIMRNYAETYDIPQVTMDYINNYCKAYKELGVKMYLGIYYMQYSGLAGYQDEWENVRISTIKHHVEKYWGPLWNEWEEAIYCVCMNLLGRYGEWTSLSDSCLPDGIYYYDQDKRNITPEQYEKYTLQGQKDLVDLVLKTVPQDLRITMRQPYLKSRVVDKSHPRYNRIGYAQDAFYGKFYPSNDMGQSYWLPDNTDGWWAMGMKEAPYSIMDAEFFTSRGFVKDGIYIEHDTCLPTMAELRLTTMSINHSYADFNMFNVDLQKTIFQGWKGEEVTTESLKQMGVLVAPGWFTDRNGEKVQRNAFEYTRDYLGYHLSAETVSITGGTKAGQDINVKMNFKNYGFSAAFNLTSGFAILDENNNVVSSVNVGDPTTWHSTSPTDFSDRTQLSHSLSADMKLPATKGTYKIAFFLKNKLGQTARLDNTIEYSNGFNILHMFTID